MSETVDAYAYPPYSSGEGPCAKCGAPETRTERVLTNEGSYWDRTIGNRARRYVPAETERREYKPVFIGGNVPVHSNTGMPPQQPDHWDEIVHPAKPERIHHTCGTCGYLLSTRCQDATDAR